jgi:membrane protease YdiL (CAAX protease family)
MLYEKSQLKYTTPVVLCLSLGAPLLMGYIISPFLIPLVGQSVFLVINEIYFWAMAFMVLIIVLFWERQSLRSIGFRRLTVKECLLALFLSILLFVLIPALVIFTKRAIGIQTKTMDVVAAFASYPIWWRTLLAARAGFVEEILYRGYTIERLSYLTGRIWPGALIGLIIHTVLHLPFLGLGHTIVVVFPVSAILTGLYVWKRNLTLNITVHFLIDFLLLVLLPLLPPLS